MNLEEAKQKLLIDKNNLDLEVEMQASIANQIGEEMVKAESNRDCLKEQLAFVDSEIAYEIRSNAKSKITEKQISEEVITTSKHVETNAEYLRAKNEAAQWKIMREDFVSRAFMLSKLCELHENDYYSRESFKIKKVI